MLSVVGYIFLAKNFFLNKMLTALDKFGPATINLFARGTLGTQLQFSLVYQIR